MALLMSVLWLIQLKTGDAGIVDVGWAGGFGVLALWYVFALDADPVREWLLAGFVCLWSARLGGYLLITRVLSGPEDGRYTALRAHWGESANRKLFFFFQGQGLADALLALPLLAILLKPNAAPDVWDVAGAALILVSVLGESLADWQLSRFRSNPANKGKTCRVGLWRYSRHPNYFFEWFVWVAYVVMGIGSPYWWLTLLSPAIMLYFILYVTGIPPTEKHALKSRGDDYRRYQQETSVFIPWFPKQS